MQEFFFLNLLIYQPWWMNVFERCWNAHTHLHTVSLQLLLPLSFTLDDQIISCLHEPFVSVIYYPHTHAHTHKGRDRGKSDRERLTHLADAVTIQWDLCCYSTDSGIQGCSVSTKILWLFRPKQHTALHTTKTVIKGAPSYVHDGPQAALSSDGCLRNSLNLEREVTQTILIPDITWWFNAVLTTDFFLLGSNSF